ncbi:MAG: TonB-dependent receptor [Bacteroidales bacterium]
MFFRKSLVFIPAMLWCTTLFAQFTLDGKVTDKTNGQPLQSAHVALQNSYRQVATSPDGLYSIARIKPGTYDVSVSFVGYQTSLQTIVINNSRHFDIALDRKIFMEDEVIISSTRAGDRTPVTYENINREKLTQRNLVQDLPALVSLSPSVVTTSDAGNGVGYSSMRIRGTDMTRINVTVNGIPLNDPESHEVYWVDLPDVTASAENLQIQRGVGTSTNGASAFGASLNLQTSGLRADPYAGINSAYGSFNTLKNSASFGTGLLNKCFTFDGRFSKIHSDGYIDRASTDLSSWFISSGYYSKRTIVKLNLISGTEKTYQAWYGVSGEMLDSIRTYNVAGMYTGINGNVKYYDNQTDNYRQDHYQLLMTHQFSDRLFANLAFHYTKGKGYYEEYTEDAELSAYGIKPIPDSITNSDLIRRKYLDNDFSGATYSLNYAGHKWNLTLGGSWNYYTGRHYGTVIWAQYAGNSEINHTYYQSTGAKEDFNLFAKAGYDLTHRIHLFGDIQYRQIVHKIDGIDDDQRDITQKHNYSFFNPKAGIFLQLNSSSTVYASVAIANREPNRSNFTDANPKGPVPDAELLYDFEAGYSLQTDILKIGANIFAMFYKNQLVLTGAINDVGAPVMTNVPESHRLGIEFTSKIKFTSYLMWEANLTLSRNKINYFTELIDNWDDGIQIAVEHSNSDIAFSPSIIGSSQLILMPIPKLTISFNTKYVGKQFIDNTSSNDRKLNSYVVNDLLFAYEVNTSHINKTIFTLMVNNLLNERYESNAWVYRYNTGNSVGKMDGYFPQAGTTLMLGINISL